MFSQCIRLSEDMLVSHSAPALMRGETVDDMYDIPGTGRLVSSVLAQLYPDIAVSVWIWLGLRRFLPDGRVRRIMRSPLNVGSLAPTQYQSDLLILCRTIKKAVRPDTRFVYAYTHTLSGSDSFKMVAEYSLPMSCRAFAFAPIVPVRHRPQLFVDDGTHLQIFSVADFKPRPPPPFPLDVLDEPVEAPRPPRPSSEPDPDLAEGMDNMSIGGQDGDDEDEDEDREKMTYKRVPPPADLSESVPHWTVAKDVEGVVRSKVSIDRWQAIFDGQLLLAVNEEGTLSIWKRK